MNRVKAHLAEQRSRFVDGVKNLGHSPSPDDDEDDASYMQDCTKDYAPYSSRKMCNDITGACITSTDTRERYDRCIEIHREAYDQEAFNRSKGISTEATIDIPQPGGRKTKRRKTKRRKTKRSKTKQRKT